MQLAPIVSRIRSQVPALASRVAVATSLEAVTDDGIKATPCAFLFVPTEKADANPLANHVRQRVVDVFGVLLIVRNVTDTRGEAAAAELDDLRIALRSALLGWTASPDEKPLEFVSGQMLYAKQGLLIWNDQFKTEFQISASYG